MCGIAGIIATKPRDLSAISAMIALEAHRGPDGSGTLWLRTEGPPLVQLSATGQKGPDDALVALGHRRLAIIDTSAAGLQPMAEGKRFWLSYNGEIYNYRELRSELQGLGAHFTTQTDSEVILKAYAQWGTACFNRFNGMWGIAILDTEKRELVLSRDRFGIKPLYLYRTPEMLAFASEIKTFTALPEFSARLNRAAAVSYLTQNLVNHTDETFFEGVRAFPPAHYAAIKLDAPQVEPVAYWQYPTTQTALSDSDAIAQFRTLFDSALSLHMRSDVPVGSCLSGGMDSSAIVCSAAQGVPDFSTFTAVFDDADIDERQWVNTVNQQTGAKPHWTTPTADDFLRDIDELVWHQDEPFSSASIYAQWCVMRAAREANIPVLLDGQGADEILCGYKKFYLLYMRALWRGGKPFAALREAMVYLLYGDRSFLQLSDGLRYLPSQLRPDIACYDQIASPLLKSTARLSAPGLTSARNARERQVQDLMHFSLPSLLRYEDRNAMAFSIESRVPFLDYRLVEFALSLPASLKMRDGQGKYVMRKALADLLPPSVLARRDKMGFGAPQMRWLAETILPAFAHEIDEGRLAIAPLVDTAALKSFIDGQRKRPNRYTQSLAFRLFVLNHWARRFEVDMAA